MRDTLKLISLKSKELKEGRQFSFQWLFSIFKPGLSLEISLIVISTLTAGLLISTFFIFTYQRQKLIQHNQATVAQLSNVIMASLEHAMLRNDWSMADEIVQIMAEEESLDRIRVLDPGGIVQVSSASSEIGTIYNRDDPLCQNCHTGNQDPGRQKMTLINHDGQEALLSTSVIRNHSACYQCHGSANQVLGLLMIEQPVNSLQGKVLSNGKGLLPVTLISFLLLAILLTTILNRLITRPVTALVAATAEAGRGNLDANITVRGRNELGQLAAAFDRMRYELKASLTDVERRNRELLVLNEVAMSAGEMRNLGQILDLALDTVVDKLGMQAGGIYLLDEETGSFTMRTCRGISEAQCRQIEQLRKQSNGDISKRVVQSGKGIFVPDMSAVDGLWGPWDDLHGRSYINIPLKSKGVVVGTMGLVSHAGQPLTQSEADVLYVLGNEIGIEIDNALLLAETRHDEDQANILYQIGTQISASLEFNQVLDVVAEGARQVLKADIGLVGLQDEKENAIWIKAVAGERTGAFQNLRLSLDQESLCSGLAAGLPITGGSFQQSHFEPKDGCVLAPEGVAAFLFVPLQRDKVQLGLIGAMMRKPRRFSQDDIQLLNRLAHQVVVAIENARLYQQVRQLSANEERDWLAREMHDHLAQALGYLYIQATTANDLLSKDQIDRARESLQELKQAAQMTYTEVREAIFNLRTPVLIGQDFLPVLKEYIERYRKYYFQDVQLEASNESNFDFPAEASIQILRIIQEALSNARKHSGTNQVWVRIQTEGDQVCIRIEDYGRGFDTDQVQTYGGEKFGLQIMRERAESVGGKLSVDAQPELGTSILLRIPRIPKSEG